MKNLDLVIAAQERRAEMDKAERRVRRRQLRVANGQVPFKQLTMRERYDYVHRVTSRWRQP